MRRPQSEVSRRTDRYELLRNCRYVCCLNLLFHILVFHILNSIHYRIEVQWCTLRKLQKLNKKIKINNTSYQGMIGII